MGQTLCVQFRIKGSHKEITKDINDYMNRNQIGWSEVLLFKCAISITLGVQSVVGTRTLRRRARVMAAGGGGRDVFLVVLRLSSSDTPQHTSHHVDKREEERQRAPGCEMASR